MIWSAHRLRFVLLGLLLLILTGVAAYKLTASTSGAELGKRALQLSSSGASATASYRLAFGYITPGTVGSVSVEFCSNDQYLTDPCVVPVSMDVRNAVLAAQSGVTGFTIASGSTANRLVMTRVPSAVSPLNSSYEFANTINPSTPGSYYARVQTYATNNATGPSSDYGGFVFYIANETSITATVPPYLVFCTAVTIANQNCVNAKGTYIDLGELSYTRASSGSSQFLAGTNAANGYNVSVQGTTLTSGNNVIAAISSADVSRPGTAQFGFNLMRNVAPAVGADVIGPGTSTAMNGYNQPNFFRFNSGDSLVSIQNSDDIRVFTVAYLANVPRTQPAGVYVSTMTYICFANF